MALSKSTAFLIVTAVSKDIESNMRINKTDADSILTRIAPESLGISGSLRNIGFVLINADPTEPSAANFVCTGIASATSMAISNALNSAPGIPDVESVGEVSRSSPAHHTATLIVMKDGSRYVFDWHQTLNATNPMIHSEADWLKNQGGMLFSNFGGY